MDSSTTKSKHYSFTLKRKKDIMLLDTFLKALNADMEDETKMSKEQYKAKLEKSRLGKSYTLTIEQQEDFFKI